MKLITLIALACFLQPAFAVSKCDTPFKIAVIDTGFGWQGLGDKSHLCKYGHRDFTKDQRFVADAGTVDPVPMDFHGHGTNIAGVIEKELSHVDYCLVILKYYTPSQDMSNAANTVKAIRFATNLHLDFINYSGGGLAKLQDEIDAVKEYLDGGGVFVAAAGNEGRDMGYSPYYPAMDDDRVFVVGAKGQNGQQFRSSNYGSRINAWEVGENVIGNNVLLSGTSQATATATGKLVSAYDRNCKITPDENKFNLFRSVANTQENSCH